METTDYQREAARTLIDGLDRNMTGSPLMMIWCAMGLAGETGEVVDILKKGILHQHGYALLDLADEMGDCLWYIAGLCTICGLDMGDVMERNIAKLKERYPDGFSYYDSKNRRG